MIGVDSLEDLKGYNTRDFVKPEVREREIALLEREGAVRDVEFQLTRRDGETRTVVDSAFLSVDPRSGEKFCHGILVDITNRKELQTQLMKLSIRDPLTGCYNRRHLNTLVRQLAAQPKAEWGCICLDIDHFKQYNDKNGHAEGDGVLVRMARFLMRHVRAEEAVVRVGGDEFLVVLSDAGAKQTERVAARLRPRRRRRQSRSRWMGGAHEGTGFRRHNGSRRSPVARSEGGRAATPPEAPKEASRRS